MHRSEKEIRNRTEIDGIIRKCQICRIALSDNDQPYLIPVCFGYDGNKIYFHTARKGRKIEIINKNNKVCFEFEYDVRLRADNEQPCKWSFAFQTVMGEGNINELTETDDKTKALQIIVRQYSDISYPFPEKALASVRTWEINIERIYGKQS